ncbi:MAG: lipopolysaccharide heptosyltransferase II [Verrucomicrobiota bacterium]|jgi:heptosyltransferase-2
MNAPQQIQPRRILVRGTNWLGDAVMTTPALMRLREKFPNAHITLLTPEKLADLWENHPAIDAVESFNADEGVISVASKLRFSMAKEPIRKLHETFRETQATTVTERVVEVTAATTNTLRELLITDDLALVLPNSPRSAIECWLARIPQRVGYARPWRNFFLTNAVAARAEAVKMRKRSVAEISSLVSGTGLQPVNHPNTGQRSVPPSNAHQIHEYLHLVAVLGANPEPMPPQLVVNPDEIEAAKKKFGLDVIGKPIFGLNPGAEYGPTKRWPVEKFIAAARDIQNRTNCTWLTFGGKADLTIASRIAAAIASPPLAIWNLAGRTKLRELMVLLKLCRVLLTNDSGPMHVAAALGTPVVVPFGSTSPELTGPGLPGDVRHHLLKSDAPCSPCFLRECPIDFRCMNGISVERVVEAVLQAIR